jgi:hypothetical protein
MTAVTAGVGEERTKLARCEPFHSFHSSPIESFQRVADVGLGGDFLHRGFTTVPVNALCSWAGFKGTWEGVTTILLIALLKALLTLVAFVAFAVITEQIIDRAPARVSIALYLSFVSIIPVTIVALELSWRSTRPFASVMQFGIASFLILVAVLPVPPELIAQIRGSAAEAAAKVSVVSLRGMRIKRRETLIHLVIIGCVLTAYFAKITDQIIPLLVSSITVIAAMIANTVIHYRRRKRAKTTGAPSDIV